MLSMLKSLQVLQETALMRAVRKENLGIVRKLIQHGANVNLTNKVTAYILVTGLLHVTYLLVLPGLQIMVYSLPKWTVHTDTEH